MAFSGTDSSSVSTQERSSFTYGNTASNDPNMQTAKGQNLTDVLELMHALKKDKPKRANLAKDKPPEATQPVRVGEKPTPNDN